MDLSPERLTLRQADQAVTTMLRSWTNWTLCGARLRGCRPRVRSAGWGCGSLAAVVIALLLIE